jgi:lipopolysaccharide assembly outer membrane protein LptD (OstA)
MSELKKYYAKIAFNLHFAPQSTIVSAILMFFFTVTASAQVLVKPDSVTQKLILESDSIPQNLPLIPNDTITSDGRRISKDAVDKDITYKATGYIKTDLINHKVFLVEDAQVNYGEIELKADSIVLDMETNSVYATGRPDSVGKLAGTPVFKEGSQEFETKELTYNFKTKKGYGKNTRTEQEGGYLNSKTVKINPDKTIFIDNSTYSTCDAEEPHFGIKLKKAKVYPGEKIVSGPAYLVVEGIPLPAIIPYGFFPMQSKRASGLIIPNFGQENSRGYYLSDGGFYFALNDYFDLKVTGSVYTNSTWLATLGSTYRVRYRYSGSLSFSYANNVNSYKGLEDFSKTTNYSIVWSHSQDSKANPSSRFSASVNMRSSSYDKNNSYSVSDLNTTTRQSSISYSKSWTGRPFNFSTSFNQTQNTKTKMVAVNLPKATFTVSRFYPLKPKNPKKERWYHDLQMQYTANVDNKINTYDSLLFTNKVWENMDNGFKQEIPVSVSIKPFNNFSISPQLKYTGVLYTKKTEKKWDPNYIDPEKDAIVPSVIDSTIRGIFYGQAIVPSFSASYSPSIYGTFQFLNPKSKIQAIRHVIKPSVGFSYVPSFAGLSSDMYRTVQSNLNGNITKYSIFEDNIYGTPSLSSRSGNVSFNITNILEAKVFSPNDTTGKAKKIKLIDNLSAGTSYNIFADTCNWADIPVRVSTTVAENVNISANSTFSIYAINSKGYKTKDFAFHQGQGLARMTGFTLSIGFDLAKLISGKSDKQGGQSNTGNRAEANDSKGDQHSMNNSQQPVANNVDEFGYTDFNMPWSMRINYSFNYSKSGLKSTITNGFSVTGDVKLTSKTSFTYSSGYNFVEKEMGNTSFGITRDLHCWQMSVQWLPVGPYKSWSFTIRPKSSILQDLKYERKKDYHEKY